MYWVSSLRLRRALPAAQATAMTTGLYAFGQGLRVSVSPGASVALNMLIKQTYFGNLVRCDFVFCFIYMLIIKKRIS